MNEEKVIVDKSLVFEFEEKPCIKKEPQDSIESESKYFPNVFEENEKLKRDLESLNEEFRKQVTENERLKEELKAIPDLQRENKTLQEKHIMSQNRISNLKENIERYRKFG